MRLRVWGFEVYDARLWTPVGFRHGQYTQFPFALELQYLRKLEGAAIASRSIDEMRRVGSFSDAQAQSWGGAMRELFPDVRQGERITGINLQDQAVAESMGEIVDRTEEHLAPSDQMITAAWFLSRSTVRLIRSR